jgi:hypothetical protein
MVEKDMERLWQITKTAKTIRRTWLFAIVLMNHAQERDIAASALHIIVPAANCRPVISHHLMKELTTDQISFSLKFNSSFTDWVNISFWNKNYFSFFNRLNGQVSQRVSARTRLCSHSYKPLIVKESSAR